MKSREIERLQRFILGTVASAVRRTKLAIGRAVLDSVVESTKCRSLQLKILEGEVVDEVEHFEPYGYTARPKAGAEAIVLSVGGNRDHLVAVAVQDRRTRPTNLEEGDAVLWVSATGGGVKLVDCKASSKEVHLGEAPENFVALANLVNARIAAIRSDYNAFVLTYNTHTHAETGVNTLATTATASQLADQESVAASKVKAK